MEKTVLMTIEYDGTGFAGWQRQPDVRTVQGVIEQTLTELCGHPVTIDGVSRTDAGVHAMDQKATFRTDLRIPVESLAKVMNDRLSGRPESRAENDDVRITACEEVDEGFNARYESKGKTYRYSIRNAASMPVFDRNYRYLVKPELDLDRMREAAEYIKGTHDFACFQASGGEPGKTTVRTVWDISIKAVPAGSVIPGLEGAGGAGEEKYAADFGKDVLIEISGDGFLYNMVRIITGTLVEVGLGRKEPEDLKKIIDSRDRTMAGHTAPPQGLCLMKVYYSDDEHPQNA